jgi:hypothetical protein
MKPVNRFAKHMALLFERICRPARKKARPRKGNMIALKCALRTERRQVRLVCATKNIPDPDSLPGYGNFAPLDSSGSLFSMNTYELEKFDRKKEKNKDFCSLPGQSHAQMP